MKRQAQRVRRMITEDSPDMGMFIVQALMFIALTLGYVITFIYSMVTEYQLPNGLILAGKMLVAFYVLGTVYLLFCYFTAPKGDYCE